MTPILSLVSWNPNDPHFGGCDHLRPRKWRVTEPNRDHLGSRKTLMIMIIMIMIIRMLVIMIVHLPMVVGIMLVIISMIPYTAWLFNIAMEQEVPVNHHFPMEMPWLPPFLMLGSPIFPWFPKKKHEDLHLSPGSLKPLALKSLVQAVTQWYLGWNNQGRWIGYSQYIWTCCVCVFIYIYIFIYVYIRTCMYVFLIHVYIYIYISIWVHDSTCTYKYVQVYMIIEGSLEVKLPTIWTVEKQRWEESEETRSEERRGRCAKR